MKTFYKFIIVVFSIMPLTSFLHAQVTELYGLGYVFPEWESNNAVAVSEIEPGVFAYRSEVKHYNDNKQIKFTLSKGDWDKVEYLVPNTVDYNGNVKIVADGGEYDIFQCSEGEGNLRDHFWGIDNDDDGVYRFIVNTNTMKLTVQKMPVLILGANTPFGYSYNLDRASMLTREEGNNYSCTIWLPAESSFKFITLRAWGSWEYRNNAGATGFIHGEGDLLLTKSGSNDHKFQVQEAGNYKITCNLTTKKINVEYVSYQIDPIIFASLYLVGTATPDKEKDKEFPTKAVKLVSQGNNKFTATKVNMTTGVFKIISNNDNGWSAKHYFRDETDPRKISTDGSDDRKWEITEAGLYDVTADMSSMTISIEKHLSTNEYTLAKETKSVYTIGNDVCVKNAENTTLRLYTLQGQLIHEANILSSNQIVHLNLPKGVYITHLSTISSTESFKINIQ